MPISTFADGFGRRLRPEAAGDDPSVETLQLCDDLSDVERVEEALQGRIRELSVFDHPAFARTHGVQRGDGGAVTLTGDAVPGTRLADILRAAERHWLDPDLPPALALLRQVVSVVAALHDCGRHLAHGSLGPERIVVRDDGVGVVVEGVLAAALQHSDATRTTLWRQYRVAVPAVAGAPSLGQAADVMQLGILALALTRGRLLGREDVPGRLLPLLQEAAVADPLGHRPALPKPVHSWIARTLQFDARASFRSAREADAALVQALADSGVEAMSTQAVAEWASATLAGTAVHRAPSAPSAGDASSTARRPSSAAVAISPGGAARRQARPGSAARGHRLRVVGLAAGILLLASGVYLGARHLPGFVSGLFPTGRLAVESRPAGLDVLIDGRLKGMTPLEVDVRAGRHTLALRSSRSTTLVPVTIEAGAWHRERIEVRRGRSPLRTSTVRRSGDPAPRPGK